MSNADPANPHAARNLRDQAQENIQDTVAKISDLAADAADEAKRSAAALASEANRKVKTFFEQQVDHGADLLDRVAVAAQAAADELEGDSPQLASMIRDASERVEWFSHDIRDQSFEDLMGRSADFARQRPAAVLGAAAAFGFLLFRLFKAGTPTASRANLSPDPRGRANWPHADAPSISPNHGQFHGA
jgi:ElaB/YqjD/DUF883 family membrane-anchored ribosome-binding protein